MPARVPADVKEAVLKSVDDAVAAGLAHTWVCGLWQVSDSRLHRWRVRRRDTGTLVDRAPGGHPVHAPLFEEIAAILDVAERWGTVAQDHATPAEEEYLQIIYWLMEAELPITGANIARAMQLSPPTVHEMVGRLEHDGYVTRAEDKSLALHAARPRAGRGDRRPPPPDRALPDRRRRHRVGRRARGGRAARARDVARLREVDDAARSATPRPARTATRSSPGNRIPGVPLADVRGRRRRRDPALRERGRGPAPLPEAAGPAPGPDGQAGRVGDDEVVLASERQRRVGHAQRRRDRLGAGPTRHRRRAPRCPSSSCSAKTATAARSG